jgi:RHS repeat-associated protein
VGVTLPSSVSYTYDGNGNLVSDGNRCFAYNDENQLTSVWVTNVWRTDFAYDGRMRLRQRTEWAWSGSAWNTISTVRYVYDGNVVVQEQDQNNAAKVSYTRGRDLSGSLQGAGGIGGLLARSDNSAGTYACYFADGNGNITCMTDTNQAVVAGYLYDPYGRILSQSGSLAAVNLYRFSSKEFHVNSGLVYYLYRFYDPSLQRWINRDPIQELGGFNLYVYVANGVTYLLDPYGLVKWPQVLQGGVAVLGGVIGIVGGAGAVGTGVGAAAGAIGIFAGGTSLGLGITAIAGGLADNGPVATPTGTIPLGLGELAGAASGNATLQRAGAWGDLCLAFATPPQASGPIATAGAILGAGLQPAPPGERGPYPFDPGNLALLFGQ